jgi:uncharacterized GH25 family protein
MTTQTQVIARVAVAAAALLAVGAGAAHAHQIWIEQDSKGARLYFGEFGANLREDSPGLLDKLTALSGRLLTAKGDKPVVLTKTGAAFTIDGRVAKGESIVAEEGAFPSWESKDGGKTIRTVWAPAARYVPDLGARAAVLTLDVVPTGKTGELQVVFRGKPLAAAEVVLVSASGWDRHAETDAEGKVTFALPWKGSYVAVVHHDDKTPGVRKVGGKDEKYDVASFVTTLSFATATGAAAPRGPAPAPPSE